MPYATRQELESIAMRLAAVEGTLVTLNPEDVQQLIILLQQVKSALKVFMWLGNGMKWVAGLGGAVAAILYGIRMALK